MNTANEFARPDLQEESSFGTNLEFLRRNLRLTPEQRLAKYLAGAEGWRNLIEGAAAWRSQKEQSQEEQSQQELSPGFSSGSIAPTPATSS